MQFNTFFTHLKAGTSDMAAFHTSYLIFSPILAFLSCSSADFLPTFSRFSRLERVFAKPQASLPSSEERIKTTQYKDRLTRFFKHIIHTCQIDLTPVFLLPFNLNVCRLTGGHYIDFCRSRSATEGFSGKLTDLHISAVLVATFMSSCLNLNNTPFTVENAGKQTTAGTLGVNERSLIAGVLT